MAWDDQPVANGIRTDHPIPNLPFVDDSHIPVGDPEAIEGIGRHADSGMWGRFDIDDETGEWMAFTTDPKNHSYSWVVHHHPAHGRSVVLYRGGDGASAHSEWFGDRPLLTRLGGYWWDGNTWYRPRQVFSLSTEAYMRRPVRQPTTITAEDLLDSGCQADLGQLHKVLHLDPDVAVAAEQWRHDLALWATRRSAYPDALPPQRCVVSLNAPELADGTLLGIDDFAREASIAASTLRAYIARDEAELPPPQVTDGGRKRWARPVALDWVERRRREPSNVVAVLSGDAEDRLAPGLRTLWKRLSGVVFRALWDQPASRRRWSRPHRNEQAVRSVADQLAWSAALHLDSTVPFDALADALEYTVLWELSRHRDYAIDIGYTSFMPNTGRLLGWFVRHKPDRVPRLFGAIVGQAERELKIPPAVTKRSLRSSLVTDGGFKDHKEWINDFLAVTLPPEK
ncbi:hypothetical protein [Actinosynnema sp. NPDC023587]|uniref:hypothetical protein n=1 Tax=Actinosynnema sp. NPDC023587 TaxID=3154695 RepID=UPI0033FC05A4